MEDTKDSGKVSANIGLSLDGKKFSVTGIGPGGPGGFKDLPPPQVIEFEAVVLTRDSSDDEFEKWVEDIAEEIPDGASQYSGLIGRATAVCGKCKKKTMVLRVIQGNDWTFTCECGAWVCFANVKPSQFEIPEDSEGVNFSLLPLAPGEADSERNKG